MLLGWAFFPAGIAYSFLPPRLFYALVPQLSNLVLLSAANVFVAVGWAFADPAEAALVADISDVKHRVDGQETIQNQTRGRAYAWYASAGSFGAIIGPLLGGWLYDQIRQTIPFYLNGFVLTICAIGTLILLRQPGVTQWIIS